MSIAPCTMALLAAVASAQCFEPSLGVLAPRTGFPAGYGDDVLFDVQPMNFAFPMGGVSASYTHAHIQSNGVIFLTNGTPSGATTTGYSADPATQLANLRGLAGQPPRIAPMWRDLVNLAANGGGVYFNNTIPGKFVVTWSNAVQYATSAPVFTVQAQLLATGEVHVFCSDDVASTAATICGVSEGNAVAAVPGVNFTVPAGNSGTSKLLFEQFGANAIDLQSTFVHFAQNVFGGYDQTATDCGAFNRAYGNGCYDISDSIYQYFVDAAGASAQLTNQSVVLTPERSQYSIAWGGATYVAPTPAAVNVFATATDDGLARVTPSIPFPSSMGPQASLFVHSNGIIFFGGGDPSFPGTNSFTPTPAGFLNGDSAGFYAWHDYVENDNGSGRIKREELVVGGDPVLFITWDDVESYPLGVSNTGTLQFQVNLATGVVGIVWMAVDNNTTTTSGSAHLVGYSPAGPSHDAGSLQLSTALPLTPPLANMPALKLAASPAPVSTATAGTLVTYTTSNIPPFDPTPTPAYYGVNVISFGQVPGGIDLAVLGAPGCSAYISTHDVLQMMTGSSPTQTVTFQIPAGVLAGIEIYSQSAALILPGSLPNAQNARGLTVSNGIRQRIDAF